MEVAEGRSAYSPLIGNVHEYIMGRLWGLIRRWPHSHSQSLSELIGGECEEEILPTELMIASTEEVVILRYERKAQIDRDKEADIEAMHRMRKQTQNQSTLAILIQMGHWSTRDAAKHCGVSRNAIEKRIKKLDLVRYRG